MVDLIWYANVIVPASAVSLPEYPFPMLIDYNVRVLDDANVHDWFYVLYLFELRACPRPRPDPRGLVRGGPHTNCLSSLRVNPLDPRTSRAVEREE